jgi:hypothetical protein
MWCFTSSDKTDIPRTDGGFRRELIATRRI